MKKVEPFKGPPRPSKFVGKRQASLATLQHLKASSSALLEFEGGVKDKVSSTFQQDQRLSEQRRQRLLSGSNKAGGLSTQQWVAKGHQSTVSMYSEGRNHKDQTSGSFSIRPKKSGDQLFQRGIQKRMVLPKIATKQAFEKGSEKQVGGPSIRPRKELTEVGKSSHQTFQGQGLRSSDSRLKHEGSLSHDSDHVEPLEKKPSKQLKQLQQIYQAPKTRKIFKTFIKPESRKDDSEQSAKNSQSQVNLGRAGEESAKTEGVGRGTFSVAQLQPVAQTPVLPATATEVLAVSAKAGHARSQIGSKHPIFDLQQNLDLDKQIFEKQKLVPYQQNLAKFLPLPLPMGRASSDIQKLSNPQQEDETPDASSISNSRSASPSKSPCNLSPLGRGKGAFMQPLFRDFKQPKNPDTTNPVACKRERDILRDWIRRTKEHLIPFQEGDKGKTQLQKKEKVNYWQLSSMMGFSNTKMRQTTQADKKTVECPQNLTIEEVIQKIEDKIIFTSKGKDTYFKRAAQRKAEQPDSVWLENSDHYTNIFNVKWDYEDSRIDHSKLKPNQLFNHFPNTRELTTKQGITKNLNSMVLEGGAVPAFFPRSYDLSDRAQVDLFMADFSKTAILNIVQKHATMFEGMLAQFEQEQGNLRASAELLKAEVQRFERMEEEGQVYKKVRSLRETRDKLNLIHFKQFQTSPAFSRWHKQNWVNSQILQAALLYAQNILNQTSGIQLLEKQSAYNHDEHFKKNCFLPEYKFSEQTLETLQLYSQFDLPIQPSSFHKQSEPCSQKQIQKLMKIRGWTDLFSKQRMVCGNSIAFLVFTTLKTSRALARCLPQYGAVDGSDNIWICKPSYNARGLGIFCFNQKSDIVNLFLKKQQAPKVVQKYIERPLLLRNEESAGKDDWRKFDIRQWVLVTSYEPLKVFIFKDAYLRICGANFDIKQFEDPKRHLSNFSLQRKFTKHDQMMSTIQRRKLASVDLETVPSDLSGSEEEEIERQPFDPGAKESAVKVTPRSLSQPSSFNNRELVMNTQKLIEKINNPEEYPHLHEGKAGKFSWEQTFYPQIKDITGKVFRRMSEVMEQHPNCFELYGLDFVIDQDLKCWLIEANMSPAIASRNGLSWLKSMTETMADGLVQIVEDKLMGMLRKQKIDFQGRLDSLVKESKGRNEVPEGWEKLDLQDWKVKGSQIQSSPLQSARFQNYKKIGEEVAHVMQVQEQNLEIRGISKNLKVERRIERIYRKHSAALLIQRVYRGHSSRLRTKQGMCTQRAQALKKFAETLAKAMEQGVGRIQKLNLKGRGFQEVKLHSLAKLFHARHLNKVVLIQKWARNNFGLKRNQELEKLKQNLELAASPQKVSKIRHPALTDRPPTLSPRIKKQPVVLQKGKVKKLQPRFRNSSTPIKKSLVGDNEGEGEPLAVFDPNILVCPLQMPNLNVEMVIPATGSYFHVVGGQIIRRREFRNPLELEEEAARHQQELAELKEERKRQEVLNGGVYLQQFKTPYQSKQVAKIRSGLRELKSNKMTLSRTKPQDFKKSEEPRSFLDKIKTASQFNRQRSIEHDSSERATITRRQRDPSMFIPSSTHSPYTQPPTIKAATFHHSGPTQARRDHTPSRFVSTKCEVSNIKEVLEQPVLKRKMPLKSIGKSQGDKDKAQHLREKIQKIEKIERGMRQLLQQNRARKKESVGRRKNSFVN